ASWWLGREFSRERIVARDFTGRRRARGHFLGSQFSAGRPRRNRECHRFRRRGIEEFAQGINGATEVMVEKLTECQPPQFVAFDRGLVAESAAFLAPRDRAAAGEAVKQRQYRG